MNNINTTTDGLLQGAVPLMTHANQVAQGYIRQEPVKSILIAAATGAALMAVLSLLNRSHHAK